MDKFLIVNQRTGQFAIWYNVGKNEWTEQSLLSSSQDDEWKMEDDISLDKNWLGRCELDDKYIKSMKGFYEFDDFDKAAAESKKLWNEYFAPNASYRVVRYFDNYFDRYESEPLPKKEARKISDEMNSRNKRYANSFGIEKV